MNIDELYPSSLKAEDLPAGQPSVVTIKQARQAVFQDGSKKIALEFSDCPKELICNKTNVLALAKVLGNNTDKWVNAKATLLGMPVTFQGRTVQSIRVIGVLPGAAPAPSVIAQAKAAVAAAPVVTAAWVTQASGAGAPAAPAEPAAAPVVAAVAEPAAATAQQSVVTEVAENPDKELGFFKDMLQK